MLDRLLRRLSHYAPPSPGEWATLKAAFSPPRSFSPGEEIMAQFASPTSSTLILAGLSARVVTLQGGQQQVTSLQTPGDFVDLHSFLLQRLDHSVVAVGECLTATVSHPDLRRITDASPQLARGLWFLTVTDAAVHRQWLTVVGRREAAGRAAHLLCELYLRLEDVGLAADGRFELDLTQAMFGDALCISTAHANRTIQLLRRAGLVRWTQRTVEILDWDGLASEAEFDPTYLNLSRTQQQAV
jgi:CRP-like cAMP-binding protein